MHNRYTVTVILIGKLRTSVLVTDKLQKWTISKYEPIKFAIQTLLILSKAREKSITFILSNNYN